MMNNTAPATNGNYAGFAQRYKTSLCRNWQATGRCMVGAKCHFAHGQEELRSPSDPISDPSVVATAMAYQGQQMQSSKQIRCKYNDIGACRYGYACHFSHSENTVAQSSAQQYQQQQYLLSQQYQQMLYQQQYAYQQQQQQIMNANYQQQMIQYQQYQQQMLAQQQQQQQQQLQQQQQQQQQPQQPQYPSQTVEQTQINNNGAITNPVQQSNPTPITNEKTNTNAELQWLEQQSQQLQQQKIIQQQQQPVSATSPSLAAFELSNEQKATITSTQLQYMIAEMSKLALSSDIAAQINSANEYLNKKEIQTSSKLLDEIINRKDCPLEEKAKYDSIIQVASKIATDLMKQYQLQAQAEQTKTTN